MKRPIIFILIVSASCQPSQNLEGIWEMDYTLNNQKILFTHGTTLLDFSTDSVSFIEIGNSESGIIDTSIIQKNAYIVDGSNIRIIASKDTLQLNFHSITTDSLAFSISDSEEITVAKKLLPLKGTRVSKSDLVGQGFEVLNNDYYHKLDFVNDTLIFDGGYYSFDNWTITTYKGFDFLNTTNSNFPKIPFVKSDNRIIALTNKGRNTIQFKPLDAKRKKSEIIGSWKEIERTLGPPLAFEYDTLQTLIITQDSISSTRFNKSNRHFYKLSSDGEFIYFPSNNNSEYSHWNLPTPWKILKLGTEELFVELAQRGDTTIIKYKKSR